MKTGVYGIFNLENGNTYIGSASLSFKYRFTTHLKQLREGVHHSRHLQAAWNKYGESAFAFQPLEETAPEDAVRLEQNYIDAWQPVYNVSPTAGSARGVKHTEEQKAKHALRMRSTWAEPEYKARVSASVKATYSTTEAKARLSVQSKQVHARPEFKAKHHEALKAAFATPEAKARLSQAVKKVHANPEVKARRTAAIKQAHLDLELKARMREITTTAWTDPEHRIRVTAAIKKARSTPEAKARRSELSKGLWADPETGARMRASIKAALNTPDAIAKARASSTRKLAVIATNIQTGEAQQYDSLAEAGRALDVGSNCICGALRGKYKSAGGFTWRYADKPTTTEESP